MEKDDKGSTMIRMGVSWRMSLLVPAYPGCPGSKAVKRSLLLLLLLLYRLFVARMDFTGGPCATKKSPVIRRCIAGCTLYMEYCRGDYFKDDNRQPSDGSRQS